MKYKIPIADPDTSEEELENVMEVVKSVRISSKGPFIEEFERNFSSYIGKTWLSRIKRNNSVTLSLGSLGVGKGNKVLVPSLTFVARPTPSHTRVRIPFS